MSGLRHALALSSRTGAIVAFAILFLLFIYPNPDGVVFSLLRAAFLGIIVLVFLELYREKNLNHTASASPDLPIAKNLSDIEKELSSAATPKLSFIMNLIAETMPGFGIAYYEHAGELGPLALKETAGENVDFASEVPIESDWMKSVLTEGKFLTPGEDSAAVQHFFCEDVTVKKTITLLALPVKNAGAEEGVIIIHADQFSDFQEYHRPLAESFALALSSIDLDRDAGNLNAEHLSFFQQLDRFQADLDIARSKEQFLGAISDFCRRNFTFDKLSLILMDPERPTEVVAEEVMGYTNDFAIGARFQRERSLLWEVFDGGEPVIVDLSAEGSATGGRFRGGDAESHHFFSYFGVPIKTQGKVIGCLVLESLNSGRYRRKEGGNLQILCARIGVLMDWWKKYNIVRETAMHDSLTGLLNHGSFIELFEQELRRASRYSEKLVLLMLDLDKFKRVNDTHGHLYGDYVLRDTSALLKNAVRNIDIVARYGGEEFAIVLVKAGKRGTIETARRIVSAVAEHRFDKDGTSVQMTISAGLAEYPADGSGVRDLISQADRAMYGVKRLGGNNVGDTKENSTPTN
ncbi:MAG: sensor domain-containing diguanylate cyclase [Candidatus Neomarinimicrobiota bacterium]|nr:sensor domain-containing diguanylate cyclase [Candidatus Neomarinimicrobiota bacterium]